MVGLARFRAHEPAAAIAPFSRALALAPSSAMVRFDLASALYQAGCFADAETRYLEAAARDDKIAPLALLNAGLAALDGGNPERAIAHLQKAEAAARAGGQEPVADEAHATLQSFTRRSSHAAAPELQRLTHAGTEALHARRYGEAAASYHRAYDVAAAEGASAGDRAELQYDLGHALWRAGDLVAAARALESAVALAPREAEFHYLLGLVHFDAGADRDAKDALVRALALGLPAGEAKRAGDILRALAETRRGETSRFFFEMRAAFGLDTNVPQSGTLVTAAHPGGEPTTAPFLEGDVDFFWRPAGNARNGFSVEYRFAQLAYLSEDLNLYSLQEHDLTLTGAVDPDAAIDARARRRRLRALHGRRELHPVPDRRLRRAAHQRARAARLRDAPARAAHLQALARRHLRLPDRQSRRSRRRRIVARSERSRLARLSVRQGEHRRAEDCARPPRSAARHRRLVRSQRRLLHPLLVYEPRGRPRRRARSAARLLRHRDRALRASRLRRLGAHRRAQRHALVLSRGAKTIASAST